MPQLDTLQLNQKATGSAPLSGEQRLFSAIIAQAVDDLDRATHREEARRWLMSDSGRPLGFRWVCELLGIDLETIRRLAGLAR